MRKYYLKLAGAAGLAAVLATAIFFINNDKPVWHTQSPVEREIPADAVAKLKEEFKAKYSIGDWKEGGVGSRDAFELQRLASPRTGTIPPNIRARELSYARKLPRSKGLVKYSKDKSGQRTQVADFRFRGPINVGGRTRALALDMSDSDYSTLLAGGVSGGMWKSINGGATWTRTSTKEQFPSVTALAQDVRAGKQNIWYYGTGEITGNSASNGTNGLYRGDGIYRSTNGGDSWELLENTSVGTITRFEGDFHYVNRLLVNPYAPASDDEVFAAVFGGIIRTTDGFDTYEFVLGGPSENDDGRFTEIAVTPDTVFYATISRFDNDDPFSGYFVSEDGINWSNITPPFINGLSSFDRTVIGITPSNPDKVYFWTNDGDDDYLFLYNRAQGTFTNLTANLPSAVQEVLDLEAQNSYNMVLKVHPQNENFVLLGATNLYRSTNGFSSREGTQLIGGYSFFLGQDGFVGLYPSHHPDQHELLFYPDNPSRVLSSHDGGLSITEDIFKADTSNFVNQNNQVAEQAVVLWEDISNGYITSQFYTIAIENKNLGDNILLGGKQDNSTFATFDVSPDSSWGDLGVGDGSFAAVTYNSIYVSAQLSSIFRYEFDEETLAFLDAFEISPPNAGDNADALFTNPFLLDPVFPNRMYVAGNGRIYFTEDIRNLPDVDYSSINFPFSNYFTALAASVEPENLLFAGDLNGNIFRIDMGTSSRTRTNIVNNDLPATDSSGFRPYLNCIAVDPRDADKIMLVYSNYDIISLYYTEDGGDNWVPVAGNLEENPDGTGSGPSVRWASILPNGDNTIFFVGTSTGLYSTESLSGMNTVWSQEGEETIGNVVVNMIDTRASEGVVAVGTHGNGAYSATVDVPLFPQISATYRTTTSGTLRAPVSFLQGRGLAFRWFKDGVEIPGAQQSTLEVDEFGEYYALVGDQRDNTFYQSNTITFRELQITGLEELELTNEVTVYPNPVKDEFIVRIATEALGNNLQMKIYDLQGRVVTQQQVQRTGRNFEQNFSLSGQANGAYILEINDGRARVTRRVQKVN